MRPFNDDRFSDVQPPAARHPLVVWRTTGMAFRPCWLTPGVVRLAGGEQVGGQARAQVFRADANLLLRGHPLLQEEIFGPATVVVEVADRAELVLALQAPRGQLTAALIGEPDELLTASDVVALLQDKVGRLLLNGEKTRDRVA
jgi:NADP-dependent aldehyde dehydrogenase